MKKDFCLDWIAALRSGLYKQAQCSLKADEAYCCIGVAGDLKNICLYEYSTSRVGEKVGLTSDQVFILVSLNDTRRKGFKYIANWIEKQILPGCK